ncbi:MAG: ABC transporter permease [Lachnospiraceae bacterium]|jgi:putative ABC transport system permease protein|nr:ABC transporter permease [Lachnospiraceae bacterium]
MNIMNKITAKSLRKNKTRTIVTIIGVILSTAMITAVTTFISSMQAYILNYTVESEGDWHGVVQNVDSSDYQQLRKDKELKDVVAVKSDGFAYLPESRNEYKPYLHVLEIQEQAFAHLPIRLLEGRLPQNGNEVVISEHIYTNGGVEYKIGDTLTLELGQRVFEDGTAILDQAGYSTPEEGEPEKLDITKERTFTVVGICKRTSFQLEGYSSPGYTLFTKLNMEDVQEKDILSVYYKTKHPRDIYTLMERIRKEYKGAICKENEELLLYMGISNNNSFNRVLYSLGTILISLIMVGSISLIYNSFAISVSERKKQFGLLSSIGATGKQRMNSVTYESFVIAGIGIPIGVISGIAGIGITLYLLKDALNSFLAYESSVSLSLAVSVPAIIVAVIVALITILLSVYIPARRSRKVSAMDAIRQTSDIKLAARQVKTSKLVRKLFGMEGDLALKNFKRNRGRYRTTVISLFVSVVLFVAASSFASYLKGSVTDVYEDMEYDIVYNINSYENDQEVDSSKEKVYQDILALDGIQKGSIIDSVSVTANLPRDYVEDEYYNTRMEQGEVSEDGEVSTLVSIQSVDHATFMEYIDKLGLSEEEFTNPKSPTGILIDRQHYYNHDEQRYLNKNILKDKTVRSLPITYDVDENQQGTMDIAIGAYADIAPYGVEDYAAGSFLLMIVDEQGKEAYAKIEDSEWMSAMYFSAKNPKQAEESIRKLLIEAKLPTANLFNLAESLQANRNIIMVISVFSYGFIVLISLITIANVFNTISTNVNLRRREFAMLKSVGMTQHGFNKMLNFECAFYGLKALIYGLPASVGITYLIYQSVNRGVEMPFRLPVTSMVISSFSVFLVVFVSMLYSMSKIRNENILDALKSETN